MLTAGFENSRRLAHAMHKSAIPFEIVTMCAPMPRVPRTNDIVSLAKYSYQVVGRYVKSFRLLRDVAYRRAQPYPFPTTYAGFCNGKKLIRILREKDPDYIVMIGGGVLSAETIRCARIGVLNAHPGLLPWVRGVDVIATALLADVALGVTLHYLDEGIDTGPVIARYFLPIGEERSLAEHGRTGELLSAAVLHCAARQLANGASLTAVPQSERFQLYRKMPAQERARAEALVEQGRPKALYHEWKTRESTIQEGKPLLEEFLHHVSFSTDST